MESGQGGEEKAVLDLDDPQLEEKLVSELKAQGVFDQFRKDCLSDVDTKVRNTSLFQIQLISINITSLIPLPAVSLIVRVGVRPRHVGMNHDEICSEAAKYLLTSNRIAFYLVT